MTMRKSIIRETYFCGYCGKSFTRRPRTDRLTLRHFCSVSCRNSFFQEISPPAKVEIPLNKAPLGTIRIRWHSGIQRAWIKTEDPSTWRTLAVVLWEQAHGPIPKGHHVHHKNRNKLDDILGNLECLSNAEHMREHAKDFQPLRAINARKASAKATPEQVRLIRQQRKDGMAIPALVQLHKLGRATLQAIVYRKTWKDIL